MAKTVNRPLEIAERARQPRTAGPPAPLPAAMPLLRWELVLYVALLAVAAGMRFWDLGSRAYHHDESLHAVYSWYLYVGRGYEHNPMMHGPFQFISNTLIFTLFTASDYTGRILYALFGAALVGMAFFLRPYLGRAGALCAAGLLALSPTLLYFSRFARNDILVAVWTLGLVICMWRYMDERRTGYLYGFAAILALSFSTQENTYLHAVMLGLFLGIVSLAQLLATWRRVGVGGLVRIHKRFGLRRLSPPATLLVLLVTLTLPLWAAGVSVLQKPLGLVLAGDAFNVGPIGLPNGRGVAVALVATGLALVLGAYAGTLWHRRRWFICAGIFWAIFVTLFSTMFTYPTGVATGVWQSLGYWLVQQDVARGGQPWYYYFVLLPIYEFLPFLFALAGMVYYWFKGDAFSWFLTFWIIVAFALYAWAAEKMPWIS
ncbi:MAG: flippase activity-associated protein Agl23, partial [Chloroflexota bacterium]